MVNYREHVRPHSRDVFGFAVDPPFRSKGVGVRSKNALVPVDDPAVHPDDGALRDVLPFQHHTTLGATTLEDQPSAGVDPKSLVRDSEPRVRFRASVRNHLLRCGPLL